MDAEEDFCGCCGDAIPDHGMDIVQAWCGPCWHHVGIVGPMWERTFEAMNGEPCPFQVK